MFENALTTCVAIAAVLVAAGLTTSYFIVCQDHKTVIKQLKGLREGPSENSKGKENPAIRI
tara:strand:+ start:132 stop:314 length:183 start_codon:yes stop_codon:yes gene_type:complete